MLTLNDGRSELWQWDTGRKLTVEGECSQVHFSNKFFGRSIDVDVTDGVAIIPDVLLQTDKDLMAWAFVGSAENGYTKISKVFKVNKRNKPADYVFTPPDQTTLQEILSRLEEVENKPDGGITSDSIAEAIGYVPGQELVIGDAEVNEEGRIVVYVPTAATIKTGTLVCYRLASQANEIASNVATINGKTYLFVSADGSKTTLNAKELHEKNDTIIIRIDEEIGDPLFAQVIATVPKEQDTVEVTAESIRDALGYTPANKAVLYDQVQELTEEQKAQVRANIGAKAEEVALPTSKTMTVDGNAEITDCVDGDITVNYWSLPTDETEMVVTARKSVNIFDPSLFARGDTDSTTKRLANGEEVTTKGLTLKYENGILTVNGTATERCNIDFISASNPFRLKAGMYQFAACPQGGGSSTYAVQWRRMDTGAVFWTDYGQSGNPNKTFDVDISIRAVAVIYSGYTCNNVQFRCQILSGLPSTDTSGWTQYYPFEGKSIVITSASTAPIEGLPAFKDSTAIDCVGGTVDIEYPIVSDSTDNGNSSEPEKAPYKHRDDAEFTVTKLNNSNQFSQNDITFVGDELWVSKENSTYYDNGTMIFRYKVVDDEFTLVGTCDCDFGHLNTMDYCAANDCLIFGNGGNGAETEGNCFVVVKNPLALGEAALIADVGIKYEVDIGCKVQALWGGSNLGDNNIVYLLSNNAATVTKVLLLKGDDGEFNGKFVALETHELETWGVQGADIFGDTLYIGGQLNGNEYAAVKEISLSDFTTTRTVKRKFYGADGTAVTGCVQGIYVDKDTVWICVNTGDTTKPVCLTKYCR